MLKCVKGGDPVGAIIDETLLIDNSADVTPLVRKKRRLSSCDKKMKNKENQTRKRKNWDEDDSQLTSRDLT